MSILQRLRISPTGDVSVGRDDNNDGVLEWSVLANPVGLAAGSFTPIVAAQIQVTATAATATSDGLTTGTIPASTSFVTVTSANANNIIVLPAPVPGTVVRLLNGGTGYELRTSDPATIAINGGTGAAAESAIGANIYVEAMCVSATAWIARQYTTAGVVSATEVAAP